MKLLIVLSFVFSFSAFAKDARDFNHAILQDVKTEIQKDDYKFRKAPGRGPASVETTQPVKIQEPQKIDKNVRQIGPNEW